ncbi:MAG TPA: amino acid permease [Pyrinomonadaceae bacterium]|nr:amino acid permease [Pyrinomonadaceae bacterium]
MPVQSAATEAAPRLARQLGLFDATMIVMGGIVGAGIFINPYVVAQQVHTPLLILGAWLAGGAIALAGAFIYAELAARLPGTGGQYVYLREAFHPSVAFLYGWALLLVTQTGGMAAVAVTFARYFLELTHAPLSDGAVAAAALALLTVVNCLGVRAGSNVQSALMIVKILAILLLVACGLLFIGAPHTVARPLLDRPLSLPLLTALGAALTPVMFAYGGWQTASFVAGEMRDPRRDLARGLLIGVLGVIALYVGVSFVCLHALGAEELARTTTPASAVMRLALGERGARIIGTGIAISTLGFLSQGMLTAPRVYFAMAADGLFFKRVATLHPRTRVPAVAIALQGVCAVVIALSGRYEQILNYVVSVDFIWFGLTGAALFVFRHRASATADNYGDAGARGFRVPGHPVTTICFVAACWLIVESTIYKYPANSVIGLIILLAGLPVYLYWRRRAT